MIIAVNKINNITRKFCINYLDPSYQEKCERLLNDIVKIKPSILAYEYDQILAAAILDIVMEHNSVYEYKHNLYISKNKFAQEIEVPINIINIKSNIIKKSCNILNLNDTNVISRFKLLNAYVFVNDIDGVEGLLKVNDKEYGVNWTYAKALYYLKNDNRFMAKRTIREAFKLNYNIALHLLNIKQTLINSNIYELKALWESVDGSIEWLLKELKLFTKKKKVYINTVL